MIVLRDCVVCVIVTSGRTPVTDLLKLENCGESFTHLSSLHLGRFEAYLRPTFGSLLGHSGVELAKGGYITVDQKEATNIPGIFAIGDVTTT